MEHTIKITEREAVLLIGLLAPINQDTLPSGYTLQEVMSLEALLLNLNPAREG